MTEHKETENQKMNNKSKEIDYSRIYEGGPLYVDPKYIEPGFKYALPTNRPGEISYYQRLGYEVVTDPYSTEIVTGSGKANSSTAPGSTVSIESKCGVTHILMRIPQELDDKFEEYKDKKNQEQLAAIGHVPGILPQHLTGTVKIGN